MNVQRIKLSSSIKSTASLSSVLALALATTLTANSSLAVDNLAQGEALYAKGDYKKAEQIIRAEILAHPKNAAAYYLLGNILVSLSSTSEAIRQYKTAASLDPSGTAGAYSKQALNNLGFTSPNSSFATRQTVGSSGSSAFNDDTQLLKKSVSSISAETNQAEQRVNAELDQKLAEINREAERKIASLKQDMQEQISANGSATYAYRLRPYQYNSEKERVYTGNLYGQPRMIYNPEELNAPIRQDFDAKIQAVRDDADRRGAELKASYKEKLAAIEDQAVTLDRQYLSGSHSTNIKLTPMGTNTFVRTYESADEPSGRQVPVLASPKSLSDVAKKASK